MTKYSFSKKYCSPALLENDEIRKQVMEHSLAKTGSDLETVIKRHSSSWFLFGMAHPGASEDFTRIKFAR